MSIRKKYVCLLLSLFAAHCESSIAVWQRVVEVAARDNPCDNLAWLVESSNPIMTRLPLTVDDTLIVCQHTVSHFPLQVEDDEFIRSWRHYGVPSICWERYASTASQTTELLVFKDAHWALWLPRVQLVNPVIPSTRQNISVLDASAVDRRYLTVVSRS